MPPNHSIFPQAVSGSSKAEAVYKTNLNILFLKEPNNYMKNLIPLDYIRCKI